MKGQSHRRQAPKRAAGLTQYPRRIIDYLMSPFRAAAFLGAGPGSEGPRPMARVASAKSRRSPETVFRLQDAAEKKRQRRRDRNRAWLVEYRARYYAFDKLGYADASTHQGAA